MSSLPFRIVNRRQTCLEAALSTILLSVAAQAGLCPTWSQIPEDRLSHDVAQMFVMHSDDVPI